MTILITGSRGYIGSSLLSHIVTSGRNATELAMGEDYRNCTFREANVIIHLAGVRSPDECGRNPKKAWAVNVTGFRNLLDRLRQGQLLIYASSSIVYCGVEFSFETASEFYPSGLYSVTKFTQDQLAILACRQGKQVIGLRLGSVNGWSPRPNYTQLINWMVQSAKNTGEVVVNNPNAVRPVLGIQDFNRAIESILDIKPSPGIYNLASFNESFESIGIQVAQITGCKYRVGEILPCVSFKADSSKFTRTCRFECRDTVETICQSLI